MTNVINQVAQLSHPHVERLVKSWLPGGEQQGHEWVVRNPTRQDHNPGSFKVNLETGRWADFATGEAGGDTVSLRAYLDRDRQPGCMLRAAYAVAALGHATVPPSFFICFRFNSNNIAHIAIYAQYVCALAVAAKRP